MIFSGVDVTYDGRLADKNKTVRYHLSIPRNLYQAELMVFNKANRDISNVFVIPVIKSPFSDRKDRIGSQLVHREDLNTSWRVRSPLSFPDVRYGTSLSKRVSMWSHEDLYIGAVCLFDQKGQRTDHFPTIQDFVFPADILDLFFSKRPKPRPPVTEADLELFAASVRRPVFDAPDGVESCVEACVP